MLSSAYCDHISLAHSLKLTKSKQPVIVIIRLMISLLVCPKVITLSGFYCSSKWIVLTWIWRLSLRPKHFSQIWQWKGFSFSWTFSICLRSPLCDPNFLEHNSHSVGFSFSWTVFVWLFRVFFWLNNLWQMLHWKGINFSWIASRCLWRVWFFPNFLLQILHSKSLMFSWTVFRCLWRSPFSPKSLWQILHSKSLIFSWTAFTWTFRLLLLPKNLWQSLHSKFFVLPWTTFKWTCRVKLETKNVWQILHWNSLIFSWTHFKWRCRLAKVLNSFSHISQNLDFILGLSRSWFHFYSQGGWVQFDCKTLSEILICKNTDVQWDYWKVIFRCKLDFKILF